MALDLQLWLEFPSAYQSERVATLLARETRPLFSEDIQEADRRLYELIEDIEFPVEIEGRNSCLWLRWYEVDFLDLNTLQPLIKESDAKIIISYQLLCDPMESDFDNIERLFMVPKDGEFECVDMDEIRDVYDWELLSKFTMFQEIG